MSLSIQILSGPGDIQYGVIGIALLKYLFPNFDMSLGQGQTESNQYGSEFRSSALAHVALQAHGIVKEQDENFTLYEAFQMIHSIKGDSGMDSDMLAFAKDYWGQPFHTGNTVIDLPILVTVLRFESYCNITGSFVTGEFDSGEGGGYYGVFTHKEVIAGYNSESLLDICEDIQAFLKNNDCKQAAAHILGEFIRPAVNCVRDEEKHELVYQELLRLMADRSNFVDLDGNFL